jgi:hypothetical protein
MATAELRVGSYQAYHHCGLGTACALKAYIMWREGLNGWPDRSIRPELHTDSLKDLVRIAGINLSTLDPIGPSWATVLQWDRGQEPRGPMLRKVARSMVEATYGPLGVVTWIRATLA